MCVVGPDVTLGKDANEAAQARFAEVVAAVGVKLGVTYGSPGSRLFQRTVTVAARNGHALTQRRDFGR